VRRVRSTACDARCVDDTELTAQLIERMARNQQARAEVRRNGVEDAGWQRIRAVDVENTAWLKTVLGLCGWPNSADIGIEAATAAWLLTQHADNDRDFQHRCLSLLAQAVRDGDADRVTWRT
jgi:hypothetical protein